MKDINDLPYFGPTITIPDDATDVSAYNGLYGCACGCGGDYAYLHLNGVHESMLDDVDLAPSKFMRRLNRLNRAIQNGEAVTVSISPLCVDGIPVGMNRYIFETQTGYTGKAWTTDKEGRVLRIYFTTPAPKEDNWVNTILGVEEYNSVPASITARLNEALAEQENN